MKKPPVSRVVSCYIHFDIDVKKEKRLSNILSMFQSIMGIYKFTDRVNRFSKKKKRNCSMILDNKRTPREYRYLYDCKFMLTFLLC